MKPNVLTLQCSYRNTFFEKWTQKLILAMSTETPSSVEGLFLADVMEEEQVLPDKTKAGLKVRLQMT